MTPTKLIYRHFLIVFTVLFLSLHCMQIHSQQTPTNHKTTAQTRTKITAFKIDSINITYKFKNTGSKDGAEVVQVYVGMSNSKVLRALKELKGFTKTYLGARN